MPKELLDYIESLPPATVNSSREIIRRTWERVKDKDPRIIDRALSQLGIYLSYDDHYNIMEPEYAS